MTDQHITDDILLFALLPSNCKLHLTIETDRHNGIGQDKSVVFVGGETSHAFVHNISIQRHCECASHDKSQRITGAAAHDFRRYIDSRPRNRRR